MRVEWDEGKSRRNTMKHRVSFETARLVFDDPYVLSIQDRVVEGEERWQSVGMVSVARYCWWPIPIGTGLARK